MPQYPFGGAPNGDSSIDPNDLIASTFGSSYYNTQNDGFSGGATFGDDELLDGLAGPTHGFPSSTTDYTTNNNMSMAFSHPNQPLFSNIEHHIPTFSNTPNNDMAHPRFAQSLNQRSNFNNLSTNDQSALMHQNPRTVNMSPNTRSVISGTNAMSLSGTPAINMSGPNPMNVGSFPSAQSLGAVGMEHSNSNNLMRSNGGPVPTTLGPAPTNPAAAITTAIATTSGTNNSNNNWIQQPTAGPGPGSFGQSFNSSGNVSSPNPGNHVAITDFMYKAGTSMPANLSHSAAPTANATVEAKRRRRRESHNLVERRRRDNINERIQDLSKIVPAHRLEDDKIRKLLTNGTPLSPGLSSTSSAGRRTGNITTGLPLDDKDKGPNKGDILNGAVTWMRDLLWMNIQLMSQREELENIIRELGGSVPFEFTDDERRMHSEVNDVLGRTNSESLSYSRTAGTGLRVPHHTDYRGEALATERGEGDMSMSMSPTQRQGQQQNGQKNGLQQVGVVNSAGAGQSNFEDSMWAEFDGETDVNELREDEEEYMHF